ncbi:hypothetical protein [Mobiluncus mulieris]|uniref:hypothetical protein n=1 Tax=Mobiluncus mulieris TaxID=2052 RepID=UPI0021E1D4A5|nr:hypothetical protein [Mobiluncus mulieris]
MCLFPGVLLSYGSFADGDIWVVVGLGEVDADIRVNNQIMCLFPGVSLSYGSFADGDIWVVVGLGEVDADIP